MKKKFLNLLLAPILLAPIIVTSCSDNTSSPLFSTTTPTPIPDVSQPFIYDSQKYQLYIAPVCDDDDKYTMANILIQLKYSKDPNHKTETPDNQDIGDVIVNDFYKNPSNGCTYKTNGVSFDTISDNVKYERDDIPRTTEDGSFNHDCLINYHINNLIVNGNWYKTIANDFNWSKISPSSRNECFNIRVDFAHMNVVKFHSGWSWKQKKIPVFSKTKKLFFSDRLIKLHKCSFGDCENIGKNFESILTLPNNLKYIESYCFSHSFFYQNELVIPQSVEKIGSEAFWIWSNKKTFVDDWSLQTKLKYPIVFSTKRKIKVPKKFQSQEEKIFGSKQQQKQQWEGYYSMIWDYYDVEYY